MGLREDKKVEQRRAILDAAIALFRRRGYEQTRVQDIIERLRISEATFFNYFPAKDALLREWALEQRFTNAVNVFLDGCAPRRYAVLPQSRAKHTIKPKRATRPGRNS